MEISTVFTAMLLAAMGDFLWWLLADARLRRMRHGWIGRLLVALFIGSQLAYLLMCLVAPSQVRRSRGPVPMWFQTITYVWHIMALPALALIGIIRMGWHWYRRGAVAKNAVPADVSPQAADAPRGVSRRQVLAAIGVAAPPILAASIGAISIQRLDKWRLRRFTLNIPQLPRALDGMTLAQVSDTHIGKFFHAERLPPLAQAVNELNADFIVFSGDLVDADLDDLPAGIDFLHRLKPRSGLAICEGNHDLIDDRGAFERILLDEGLPILVGNQMTLEFRGQALQFLGVPWNSHDDLMADSVNALAPRIRREAFPILLAHHPHCFDAAAQMGLPLVLSGHTHGGQLMINEKFGAGAVRFRYISGLYRKLNSALLVSNGIGNWFPVRVNAPAELLHITLRSTI